MDRETVLEKSRSNASKYDEYRLLAIKDALRIGLLAGVVLCFIFETVVLFQEGNYWGYHSILFAVSGVASLVYYIKIRQLNYLILGICAVMISVFSIWGFFAFG